MLVKFVISILFCVASLYLIYLAHEKAHQEIYRLYDIKSKITNNGLTSWETTAKDVPEWKAKEVMFAQALNEVFGYPIMALSIIIMSLVFIIINF